MPYGSVRRTRSRTIYRAIKGSYIAINDKYVTLKELTPYALHELVKAIYIEAPDKSSGKRRQNIHISYDFVSIIPIYELMQEGMA